MLLQMLSFQDELNKKLNVDWKNAGYVWSDAILLESAELFDHLPWKWWKTYNGDVNWGQIQLEAVDIWHFMMSQLIEGATEDTMDALVEAFESMKDPNASVEAVKSTVRHFMKSIQDDVSDFDFEYYSLPAFCNVLSTVGLSFEALYKLYVSKVKLNEFRWKNGYGSKYIKDWLGQEDNEYLTQLVGGLNVDDPEFAEKITAGLEARYQEVLAAQAKKDQEKQEQYVKHIEEIL